MALEHDLKELTALPYAERIERAEHLLSKYALDADARVRVVHRLVQALRMTGRFAEAASMAEAELLKPMALDARCALLQFVALLALDRDDRERVAAVVEEMEAIGIPPVIYPSYCDIKARQLRLVGDDSAIDWFKRAVEGSVANGNDSDAQIYTIWGAIHLVDFGKLPEAKAWIAEIADGDHYRAVLEADVAWREGNTSCALSMADDILRRSEVDVDVRARADIVKSEVLTESDPDQASRLAEQALDLATSVHCGIEPQLVSRIREQIARLEGR